MDIEPEHKIILNQRKTVCLCIISWKRNENLLLKWYEWIYLHMLGICLTVKTAALTFNINRDVFLLVNLFVAPICWLCVEHLQQTYSTKLTNNFIHSFNVYLKHLSTYIVCHLSIWMRNAHAYFINKISFPI